MAISETRTLSASPVRLGDVLLVASLDASLCAREQFMYGRSQPGKAGQFLFRSPRYCCIVGMRKSLLVKRIAIHLRKKATDTNGTGTNPYRGVRNHSRYSLLARFENWYLSSSDQELRMTLVVARTSIFSFGFKQKSSSILHYIILLLLQSVNMRVPAFRAVNMVSSLVVHSGIVLWHFR